MPTIYTQRVSARERNTWIKLQYRLSSILCVKFECALHVQSQVTEISGTSLSAEELRAI